MKKLLKYGLAQGFSSCIPIIMWFLISLVYNNKDYANIFTITYSFQFIMTFLLTSLISGSLIYEDKNNLNTRDYSWSAVITSSSILGVITAVFVLNADKYFQFMGVSVEKYFYFYVYSVICFVINLVIAGVVAILQFDGEEDLGCKIMLKYYMLQVGSILFVRCFFSIELVCIILSLLACFIYSILIFTKYSKISMYRFNCFHGVKYRLQGIVSSVSMFMIYLFGLRPVMAYSEVLLASYNLMSLCTDTQWDVLSAAVETDASIKLCNGEFNTNKRETFKNAIIFSVILIMTSVLMMIIWIGYNKLDRYFKVM
jgi:hypothetical protein